MSVCFKRPQERTITMFPPACMYTCLFCDTLTHTHILTHLIGTKLKKTCQLSSPCGLNACLFKCFCSPDLHAVRAPASLNGMHCHYWLNYRCNCIKLCFVALPPQWIHYWAGLSAHCCFGVQYRTSNQYDTLQGKDRVRAQLVFVCTPAERGGRHLILQGMRGAHVSFKQMMLFVIDI